MLGIYIFENIKTIFIGYMLVSMKRPLALIGITYLISLTFLNLVPDSFIKYSVYVFAVLFFISLIFKKLRKSWVLPTCFATCFISTIIQTANISKVNEIQKLNGEKHIVSGKIYDVPYKSGNLYEYTVQIQSIDKTEVKPFFVDLKTNSAIDGDIYSEFTEKIKFEPIFPNLKMYYYSKNIFILGKLSENQNHKTTDTYDKDWRYHILKLRQKIISIPKEFLNPDICSVINAVLIGEKTDMPENIKKDFQKIGVYHLLATSGMHVAIISQFIFYIFKKLKIKEKNSALLSSLVMVVFMAVVGFTPSVTRACIMAIIYFLGICISKKPDPLNSLGTATLIICAVNPFASCDVSLWLSFLATLGIILCYSPIKNYISAKIKPPKSASLDYVISTLSVTLCAFIFTIPIAILQFKKISLLSLISNLIFIPGINIIINLSAIINTLKIVSVPNFALEPIVMVCGHITNSLIKTSELLASIPYACISLNYQEAYVWLLFTMILIALTIIIKPTKKAFTVASLISVNAALICIFLHQIFNDNKLDVSFVPCKDGICAILSKNNHLAVISCVSDNSKIENISDTISDSCTKDIDYLNLYIEKNTDANAKKIQDLVYKYPVSNTVLNSGHSIKFKNSKKHNITFYKSNAKTTFWGDISVTNLKIGNHTYIKIDTPNINFIIFPDGGNAEKLPENWKSCKILVANGLPINYSCINFERAIISSNSKDSSANITKLLKNGKTAFSLYDQGEIHIKANQKGNYKLRRFA